MLKDPILSALKYMAERNKDHATLKNHVGFNKHDSRIGMALAKKASLTEEEAKRAKAILFKYRRTQLPQHLVNQIWGSSTKRSPFSSSKFPELQLREKGRKRTHYSNPFFSIS